MDTSIRNSQILEVHKLRSPWSMIPRVRKCCIAYTLQVGTRLIGAFLIVQAAVSLRFVLHLAYNPRSMDIYGREVYNIHIVNGIVKTILGSVIIALSYWNRTNGTCLQVVAVIEWLYHVVFLTKLTSLYAQRFNFFPPFIVHTISFLMGTYFFLVLWNYGLQLKEDDSNQGSSSEDEGRSSTII